jgi:hypothetical protein
MTGGQSITHPEPDPTLSVSGQDLAPAADAPQCETTDMANTPKKIEDPTEAAL